MNKLGIFKKVRTQSITNLIMAQIKDLILDGKLVPGERLPSEAMLAKQLEVSRGEVREVLSKLELHGVVKTLPQSGTFLAEMGVRALSGIILSILNLEKDNFISLFKSREFLEEKTALLAAEVCTTKDVEELQTIHEQFIETISKRETGIDVDMFFHLKIAEFSRNSYLSYFLSLIIPEIFTFNRKLGPIDDGRFEKTIEEHFVLMEAIKAKDAKAATKAMVKHLERTHTNRLIAAGYTGYIKRT
jgi:GntR family transcriptional repressor for pyruvate dehydrogenase complex